MQNTNIINFNDLDALEAYLIEKNALGITGLLVQELKEEKAKSAELKEKNKTLTDAVDQLILDSLNSGGGQ